MSKVAVFSNLSIKEKIDAGNFPTVKMKIVSAIDARSHAGVVRYLESIDPRYQTIRIEELKTQIKNKKINNMKNVRILERWKLVSSRKLSDFLSSNILPSDCEFIYQDVERLNWFNQNFENAKIVEMKNMKKMIIENKTMDIVIPETRVALSDVFESFYNQNQYESLVDTGKVEEDELEAELRQLIDDEKSHNYQLSYEIKVLFNQFLSMESDGLIQPLYLNILKSNSSVWDMINKWKQDNNLKDFWLFLEENATRQIKLNKFRVFVNLYRYVPVNSKVEFFEFNVQFDKRIRDLEPYKQESWFPDQQTQILFYWTAVQECFGQNQAIKLFNQQYQLDSGSEIKSKSLDEFRKKLNEFLAAYYNKADYHLSSSNASDIKTINRSVVESKPGKKKHCTICDSVDHYPQFCSYIDESKRQLIIDEFRAARNKIPNGNKSSVKVGSDKKEKNSAKKDKSREISSKSDHSAGGNKLKKHGQSNSQDKKIAAVVTKKVKNPSILESEDFEMFELETSVFISAALSRRESLVQLDDGANNSLFNDKRFFKTFGKLRTIAAVYGAMNSPVYKFTHGGNAGVFGKAFYCEHGRSIMTQSYLQELGFEVKFVYANNSIPTLITSKILCKNRFEVSFDLQNGVYVAPTEYVLELKNLLENYHDVMAPYVTRGNPLGILNDTNKPTSSLYVEKDHTDVVVEGDAMSVDERPHAVHLEDNHVANFAYDDATPTVNKYNETSSVSENAVSIKANDDATESSDRYESSNSFPVDDVNPPVNRVTQPSEVVSPIFLKTVFSYSLNRVLTSTELKRLEIVHQLHLSTHHSSAYALKQMISHLYNCKITPRDVDLWKEMRSTCKGCVVNMTMPPPQQYSIPTGAIIGTYWEADLFFFFDVIFMLMIELVTGFGWIYFPKSKSETSMSLCAKAFFDMLKRDFPLAIVAKKYIHSDREASFKVFETEVVGLTVDKAPTEGHAYRVEANGKVIKMKARSVLSYLKYRLPKRLIPKLLLNVNEVRNKMIPSPNLNLTPSEQVYGIKTDMDDLIKFNFGDIGYVVVPPNQMKTKKLPPVLVGILIGFEPRTLSNLQVYIMAHNSIISRAKFVHTPNNEEAIKALNEIALKDGLDTVIDDIEDVLEINDEPTISSFMACSSYIDHDIVEQAQSEMVPPTNELIINTSVNQTNTDSMTNTQAIKSFGVENYEKSVMEDINNFDLHDAIEYACIEHGYPLKSVTRAKFEDNGKLKELRTRFAALGNLQKPGTYEEVESYMISKQVLFLIMSLARQLDATILSSDIPAAYLNADLKEKKPILFSAADTKIIVKYRPELNDFINSKGQLGGYALKAINGFKESGNRFMLHHREKLMKELYTPCQSEQNLYLKKDNDGLTLQAVHTDDIFAMVTTEIHERKLIAFYEKNYSKKKVMKWDKNEFKFLGMHVRMMYDKSIVLDMSAYTLKVLQKRCTESVVNEFRKRRGRLTPSDPDFFIGWDNDLDGSKCYSNIEITNFLSCLMELNYMVLVRVDILKECTFLAKRVKQPCERAWKGIRRLWAYLYENPYHPIKLGAEIANLTVYADAAYAVHDNARSHTGIFITMGDNGGPIMVKSYVQDLVTLSSSEAETSALVDACIKKCFPLAKVMVELGIIPKLKILAYEDNTSTITIVSKGEGYSGKNRHFRVRHHALKEMIGDGTLEIKYCPSENMIADFLTKCKGISGEKFYEQIVRAMFQGDSKGFEKEIEVIKTRFSIA